MASSDPDSFSALETCTTKMTGHYGDLRYHLYHQASSARPPQGSPVVLFHPGMNVLAAHYEYHNRYLADKGMVVLSVEVPGQGAPGELNLEKMLENVTVARRFIDEELRPSHVIYEGHSLGATALLLASMGLPGTTTTSFAHDIDDAFARYDSSIAHLPEANLRGLETVVLQATQRMHPPDGMVLIAPVPDYKHLAPFQRPVERMLRKVPENVARHIANLLLNYPNKPDVLARLGHGANPRQRLLPYPEHLDSMLHLMHLAIPDKNRFLDEVTNVYDAFTFHQRLRHARDTSLSPVFADYDAAIEDIPKLIVYGGLDGVLGLPLIRPNYRRAIHRRYASLGYVKVVYFPWMSHLYATHEHTSINLRIQEIEQPRVNGAIVAHMQAIIQQDTPTMTSSSHANGAGRQEKSSPERQLSLRQ